MPFETVRVDTGTGPHCMGRFASRATHRAGHRDAIVRGADEALPRAEGDVRVIGSSGSSMTVHDVALAAHFKHGKTISGRGMYMMPKSEVVPETGEMHPDSTEAHACTVADLSLVEQPALPRGHRALLSRRAGLQGCLPERGGPGGGRRRRAPCRGARGGS